MRKTLQIKDISNHRFGKLQVLALHPTSSSNGHAMWDCVCDCGKHCTVNGCSLRKGATISCGCSQLICGSQNKSFRGFGEISLTRYNSIKYAAKTRWGKKRDIEFNVSIEYLWELFLKQSRKCTLTGLELKFPSKSESTDGTASLDRIDSTKGYIKGNVQWIHKDVNIMKQFYSQERFIDMCRLITAHTKNVTFSPSLESLQPEEQTAQVVHP